MGDVASDFLDEEGTDGQIGVGLDIAHSSHSGPVELVSGGFEPTVGSFDCGSVGIEVCP